MISLSLSVLPPYLTYILIGCERDGIQCPELNNEVVNSPHIYAEAQNFISVRAMLRGPLDTPPLANLILEPITKSYSKTTERRFVLFFHNSCFIVGVVN